MGFEQALEVKKRILSGQDASFFDKKGRAFFSVQGGEIERAFVLCITVTPRGPFGNDLSYQLKKESDEPFPLALNLFDFETICDHLKTPNLFLGYLAARESLHGRVRTGDELNYAGYFLKHGNLTFQDDTFLWDDFSQIFDREW